MLHCIVERRYLTPRAGITMVMRHPDGRVKHVWLARRSLLVMAGAARYEWTHGIPCRKTDVVNGKLVRRGTRLSLTFRKVHPPSFECACEWPKQCDSQLAPEHVSTLESRAPPPLEVQHVHQLYGGMPSHVITANAVCVYADVVRTQIRLRHTLAKLATNRGRRSKLSCVSCRLAQLWQT